MNIISKIEPSSGGFIILERLTQGVDEMILQLPASFSTDLSNYKSDLRKKQVLFVRDYLNRLNLNADFYYDNTGKPHLKNKHISISHSKDVIGIYIHPDKKIGIDVEHYGEKIFRVASRFMNEYEKNKYAAQDLEVLTLIWSAKECVFKKYGAETTFFASHQTVLEIDTLQKMIVVEVKNQGVGVHERLFYQKLDSFVLVYST